VLVIEIIVLVQIIGEMMLSTILGLVGEQTECIFNIVHIIGFGIQHKVLLMMLMENLIHHKH